MTNSEKMLLRRRHELLVTPNNPYYEQEKNEKALAVSILKNVQALGFTFSRDLMDVVLRLNRKELEKLYFDLIAELKSIVGADVEYNPMYPNFPRQVMEASDAELFINAIIHYRSFGTLMPEYKQYARMPLIDDREMTALSQGRPDEIREIFGNLCLSKTSLSEQDKQDIVSVVSEYPDYMDYLPDEIPLKENVALIGKLILENSFFKSAGDIKKYFKTATDVLRLATALSDGDLSLAKPTKYRSMKRWERRVILDLLVSCANSVGEYRQNPLTEDMFRYREQWLRVAERVHPFDFREAKYAKVNEAFDNIRNHHKPLMFGGKVQRAIQDGRVKEAAEMLMTRPGEFARRLDYLLRSAKETESRKDIVHMFAQVAQGVSTPVLLQVREHFICRTMVQYDPVRVFFPKGNLAKAMVVKNELPFISPTYTGWIARICTDALTKQYAERPSLGNVYIDESFIDYLVPFSQRSASKASRTIVRGSKLSISENAKAVRGFIWWTNVKGEFSMFAPNRVDIDLSAAIFDENWQYVEHVSYTNLRSSKYRAYHSGDITNGGAPDGKGVAEFLDIDVDAVAKNAGRYVVFQVYSYTGQKFSDIPNVRFGWMEREDVDSGEIFEPSTVEMKIDLTSESTVTIPVIFDCVERRFIWCDMNLGLTGYRFGGNNLESNLSGVAATCYGMTHLKKPNLYDLVVMNASVRGNIVSDRNSADIIFSNDTTPPVEIIDTSVKYGENASEEPVVREKTEIPIITASDIDYFIGNLL